MITEDYVSFEVAKLLKEKGFVTPCDWLYCNDGTFGHRNSLWDKETFPAPTHQLALKWLMDNYNLFFKPEPVITKYGELKWVINIYNISIYYVELNLFEHLKTTVKCNSLYDAIEKALKHSLKYLVKKG